VTAAPKCPICRLRQHGELLDHLADQHSTRVLAEELLASMERTTAAQRALNDARQMCRKRPFPSEADALQALLQGWQSRSPKRKEIRAYRCDQCPDAWHLTSRPLLADVDDGVAS
jgi:hypothetical protein